MAHGIVEGAAGSAVSVPRKGRWGARALFYFNIGFATLVASIVLPLLLSSTKVDTVHPKLANAVFTAILGAAVLAFFFGVIAAVVELVRMLLGKEPSNPSRALWLFLGPVLAGGFFTLAGTVVTLIGLGGGRGRQIRKRGKALLAPIGDGDAWAALDLSADAPDELRAQLAARWRENGQTEHASVAAFARLTLDLMALGAPASLIEDANRDSLDEIRHAELCFSLARALDGQAASPTRFPAVRNTSGLSRWRSLALATLAVDSLIDGALHEGLSARVLARLAKRCEDGAAKEVLLELARDEGRHAAHGWDVLEWCLAEGGAPVAHALLGAAKAIPARVKVAMPEGARSGAWEKFGLHGEALEMEEHQKARTDLFGRVAKLVQTRQSQHFTSQSQSRRSAHTGQA